MNDIVAGTTTKNIAGDADVMTDTGHRIVAVGMVMNFHMTFPSTPTVLMEFPRTMAFRGLVWYRGLPSHLFTWEQWRKMILNNFQKKRNLHGSMKAMIDCTANKYDTYYEYHFAKLALIHKLKLPISQGDQVNLVMGGLEDKRIKIAIETSNINYS
ncbi:hypothetical protein GEV33_001557 [Tenebrio molitor]|uniref:Uncharacterized protein n=1 Tax=Tenebrio molitor TaxID=7067 RepID=A0A8J6HUT1_TENMO|nr:hypothetical protein GEV33_001557 [Tenebrio molitor]